MSPKTFEKIEGEKTTGLFDGSSPPSLPLASLANSSKEEDDLVPTDHEVKQVLVC